MEKISLETDVMWWYEQACKKYLTLVSPALEGGVRELLSSMPFMQANPTMRRLCVSVFGDFFAYEWHHVCILFYLLGKYGLRIEMRDDELAEYEGEPMLQDTLPDAIDWEQRRWELAMRIFAHDVTFPYAINEADKFIKKYKESIEDEQ